MLDHESDEDLRQVLIQTVAETLNLHMNMKNSSNQSEFSNQIIITRFNCKILKSANIWNEYRQDENYADLLSNKQKKWKRQFNVLKSEYVSDADLDSSFNDDITVVSLKEEKDSEYENDDVESKKENEKTYQLMLTIFKHLRTLLKRKTAMKQKCYDQKKLNIQMMLNLNLNKIYINMNLNDVTILKWALILLCQTRFEMNATYIRITLHIVYDVISLKMTLVIQWQMMINEKEYASLFFNTTQ